MDDQVKQRVVGGLVIVAILAIFLPILLHKPTRKTGAAATPPVAAVTEELKLQPQTDTALLAQNTAEELSSATTLHPVVMSPVPAAAPVVAVVETPPVAVAPKAHPIATHHTRHAARPTKHLTHHKAAPLRTHRKKHHAVDQHILASASHPPKAWVLQLATFANAPHAKRLAAKLRHHGFDAFTRKHGHFTSVSVGPEIHRQKLVTLRARLSKKFHLTGIVRRYAV